MNDSLSIPTHVGIIMDGNRRWALARGLPSWRGHARGQEILHRITRAAFRNGVQYLTVYAFSTENWRRDEKEVGYLMRHVGLAVKKYINEFVASGIKVVFLGKREGLSRSVLRAIDEAESKTATNTSATLAICFNYGGMQELVDAARQSASTGSEITPELMASNLYEPEMPPLDFVIRTGGEQRLSNFMLWRAAYAELYFTDTLWPDFDETALEEALGTFAARQRRFGG
jgi:undecaprenyl diphosphate synthase